MTETGSILRPTLLGSLLDVAAHNRDRGRPDLALFESGAVYRARGRTAAGRAPRARRAAARGARARARGAASRRPAPTSSPRRVCSRPSCGRCASRRPFEPEPRPFLHPGRAAPGARRRRQRRLPRRGAPARGRALGLRGAGRRCSRSTSAASSRTRRRPRPTPTSRASRPCATTSPCRCPPTPPPPRCVAVVRGAGGELLRERRGLRRLRGRAGGRGPRRRSRCTSASARRTARSPTRRSASACEADPGRGCRPAGGRARVPSAIVAGASGYTGALAAALLQRHPADRARRRHEPQRRRAAPGRPLPAPPRAARPRRASTSSDHDDVDAAIVAYPHGAAAPVVAELRERGVKVVDLSADFRLRDLAAYERVVRRARRARAVRRGASTGCPSCYRDEIAGADLVANPGCYPTATLLALAPLARAGLIADVVIDAKSGVSGAGRAATATTHFVERRRERHALRRRAPPPHARDRPGAARARAREGLVPTFTPHLLPLDQGELVSCYVTPAEPLSAGRARPRSTRRPTPTSRSSSWPTRPPGVRDVRDTNVCRIHAHADPRTGKVLRVRGDRQPLEGRRVAGRAEPQPHVRPRRDRGHLHERALLQLALGREPARP